MTSRTHTPEDVQKIMEPWRDSASDYERGFIDGMQKQMQSSVDKAVNAMTQPTYYIPNKDERTWVSLTNEEIDDIYQGVGKNDLMLVREVEAKLREKNT
jgi:hypothetical protein